MINFQNKYHNLSLSCGIIVLSTIAILLMYYPSPGDFGPKFGVSIIYILISNTVLPMGVFVLVLRLIRVLKKNTGLIYIFLGIINLFIGLLAIYLFFAGTVEMSWLNRCFLNLLVGFVIISDAFIISFQDY